ncbi:jg11801 [Pararge aegeria aegeria]|uniref:Jg11801 protein n=1 Tax=Pararge aegeria aegeria TaxID=348720 RepID=A0A8S4S435_9NEOP|nr:jg11801 [Pararge aegeria aegeria]
MPTALSAEHSLPPHAADTNYQHPPLQRELRRPRSFGRSLIANDSLKCIFQLLSEPHSHSRIPSAHQVTIQTLTTDPQFKFYCRNWLKQALRALNDTGLSPTDIRD